MTISLFAAIPDTDDNKMNVGCPYAGIFQALHQKSVTLIELFFFAI